MFEGFKEPNQMLPKGNRPTMGVGYVIIPSNVEREEFVDVCYKTNTLSILTEGSMVFHNVLVDVDAMQSVEFPEEESPYGTPVIWASLNTGQVFVVGVLIKKGQISKSQDEKSMRIIRADEKGSVSMNFDGVRHQIDLNVNSIDGASRLNIVATDPKGESLIDFKVGGNFQLFVSNTISFYTNKKFEIVIFDEEVKEERTKFLYVFQEGFTYEDEFGNKLLINKDFMRIQHNSGKTFEINESAISLGSETSSAEKAVLGDTLKSILDELFDEIAKLTVNTPLGPSTVPINIAAFQQIKAKLETILSKLVSLDS